MNETYAYIINGVQFKMHNIKNLNAKDILIELKELILTIDFTDEVSSSLNIYCAWCVIEIVFRIESLNTFI